MLVSDLHRISLKRKNVVQGSNIRSMDPTPMQQVVFQKINLKGPWKRGQSFVPPIRFLGWGIRI